MLKGKIEKQIYQFKKSTKEKNNNKKNEDKI